MRLNAVLENRLAISAPSTVGRTRALKAISPEAVRNQKWRDDFVDVSLGDSSLVCASWPKPDVIVSDGAYGILGFEGDTSDHSSLPVWYERHIQAWSRQATARTVLWFWNTEIGWAVVHPILEKYGWRYVNTNIWNKGIGHVAGNVNTSKIRRFPVVSEVCAQYVFEARVAGHPIREWLLTEWKRTGLPVRQANEACGVADAATRKYFDQGHLWYPPPPAMFERMSSFANRHGRESGRPYFSLDGASPGTGEQWELFRSTFKCPHGFTNVWDRPALRGKERYKIDGTNGKASHLNQKPLDLMMLIVEASSNEGDVIWEPFGGLFSACVAARKLARRAYGAEVDPAYFEYGVDRLILESRQLVLP